MTATAIATNLFGLAAKALLNSGTGQAALEMLPNIVAGAGEIDVVKNLATVFQEMHDVGLNAGGSSGATFGAQQLLQKISELKDTVDKLEPILGKNSEQWKSLNAIVEGLQTGKIDLHDLDGSALTDLKELTGHLETIHQDLDSQQTSAGPQNGSSTPAPTSPSQALVDLLKGKSFELSEKRDGNIGTLLSYLVSNPKDFHVGALRELKLLHNELQLQGGKELDVLKAAINKLDGGESLTDQEHTDLTHLVGHVEKNHQKVEQSVFEQKQSMDKLLNSATDQVMSMIEREFNNGGSLPGMVMKAMGVNLGNDAKKYLNDEIFTGDFKSALGSLIQGKDADTSKLDSSQKTILSVASWGISAVKFLPKGAINLLPMLNTASKFFAAPLMRIPGLKFLYGPLSLGIDFIGVNAKEMSTLLEAIHDASNQGTAVPKPKQQGQPQPAMP